ncbi:S41 family peptidase [Candidatus Poribacteria bacterium]|nr:S41 family peptidase [Candidatus Poribacteria bacterium]
MKNQIPYIAYITLIITVFISFGVKADDHEKSDKDDVLANIAHFSEVLATVMNEHIDQPESKKVMEGAIRGMLRTLDPYSQYIPDYLEFNTQNRGNYGGLGMTVGMQENRITVITPFKGNPAALAGVQNRDVISQIDGESTAVMTLDEAVNLLRGEPGTPVTITVIRPKESKPREITIVREVIRIPSVEKEIIGDRVGYIKINNFLETTANDVDNAFDGFIQNDIRALILDLRFNPGGLLTSAVDIASDFIVKDKLVVYSQGLEDREDFFSKGDNREELPLIVLVDGGSASASEIVAGAIKDHGRGLIMGSKTFGKASVQKVFPLGSSGAAVKITVARYYTPEGHDIDKIGIIPDVETAFFSRSEQQMQLKLRKNENLKSFLEVNGDDILDKLFQAEHASREDRNAMRLLQLYRQFTDSLTDEQIILSDSAIKYTIALETENTKDDIIHDPQVVAAIEQLKVLELFAKKE